MIHVLKRVLQDCGLCVYMSCKDLVIAYWVIFHAFLSSADFFQN